MSAATRDLKNQRVAVTGSAGVIGRELLRRLTAAGAEVLSWDREPLPADALGPGITHQQSDLSTADLTALREFAPRAVFHLAAAFERSVETPDFWEANWRDNTLASHRVVDALRLMPQTEVCVFASSYLIYSPALYLFPQPPAACRYLREDDAITTRNLCGAAKLYTERELDFVHELVRPDLRIVHARIYRVYGRGSRDIVSRWVRAALRGEELSVYNAENRFDYIFAGDVAEGLLRLAQQPAARGIVNLGSGQPRRVGEVLDAICGCIPAARARVIETGSAAPFEASAADVTRLEAWLRWRPPTALETGVKLLVDYERVHNTSPCA